MLREAAPYGLVIYGFGWQDCDEFRHLYKGVLPLEDLMLVYRSSKVVIGTTDDIQRSLGMVNNRVFEVLSCDCLFVSDHYPALEALIAYMNADHQVRFYKNSGDVKTHIESYLQGRMPPIKAAMTIKHTYDHRVVQLGEFLRNVQSHPQYEAGVYMPLKVATLIYRPTNLVGAFDSGFVAAMEILDKGTPYNISWINVYDMCTSTESSASHEMCTIDPVRIPDFSVFHVIIVKSNWDWIVDSFARTVLAEYPHVRTILAISGVAPPPPNDAMLFYDVLVYETDWYRREYLASAGHPTIVQAFGINMDLMKSDPAATKKYDYLGIGTIVGYKRPWLIASKSGRRAWVGDVKDEDIAKQLVDAGVEILPPGSQTYLCGLINQAKTVYLPTAVNGGGERAVLEARACNVDVLVENDNPKLKELTEISPIWDQLYYARKLGVAILSAVTQPRARSKITVRTPSRVSLVSPASSGGGWFLHYDFSINDFTPLAGDGFFCFNAVCLGANIDFSQKCSLHDDITVFFMYLPFADKTPYTCVLTAQVMNSVYAVPPTFVTDPVRITVQPRRDEISTENARVQCTPSTSKQMCERAQNPLQNDVFIRASLPRVHAPPVGTIPVEKLSRIDLTLGSLPSQLWREGESYEGLDPVLIGVDNNSTGMFGHIRLWGQGGLSLRNTRRRSLVVYLPPECPVESSGVTLRRFVLLSLFEDPTNMTYASSISVFRHMGVWKGESRLVHLVVDGISNGMYLLAEHPHDVSTRLGASSVATRNLDDQAVAVGYDTFGSLANQAAAEWYRSLISHGTLDDVLKSMDVSQYLRWLALNNLLQNGDFIDEVYFSAINGTIHVLPWDLDTIFQPCHMDGVRAVKDDPLLYCAESALDHFISRTPALRERLLRVTIGLLDALTPERYCGEHVMPTASRALSVPGHDAATLARRAAELCDSFQSRHTMLSGKMSECSSSGQWN